MSIAGGGAVIPVAPSTGGKLAELKTGGLELGGGGGGTW